MPLFHSILRTFCFVFVLGLSPAFAQTNWYVDGTRPNGSGTETDPFQTIDAAFRVVQPGDTVFIKAGNYLQASTLTTRTSGAVVKKITVKGWDPKNKPVIEANGKVMDVYHANYTFEDLIFDSRFANADVIRVRVDADHLTMKNCEVRNAQKDGIDISSADDVLIEDCYIHHMLAGTFSNQVDAHGIVATGQRNLTIRGCEISHCSGDCFQTDPNRGYPLWDSVLIENTKMWTGPLTGNMAGWLKGESPGENAIDTKINPAEVTSGYRPVIMLKNVQAWGWTNNGYISLRAAFNIKEQVNCTIDGVICYDNQLAFRLRGPGSRGGANIVIQNALVYDNEIAIRPEDDIEKLHVYNSTFDKEPSAVWFQEAGGGYDANGFKMLNCLFVNDKPVQADGESNIAVDSTCFVFRAERDYRLKKGCEAIDSGVDIPEVRTDIVGRPRPRGFYDIGAYEYEDVSSVWETDNSKELSIYPQPSSGIIYLKMAGGSMSNAKYRVYDLQGKEILNGQASSNTIDLNDLENGIYLIQINIGDQIFRKKIVKSAEVN